MIAAPRLPGFPVRRRCVRGLDVAMFHPHSPSVRRDFGRDAKFTKFQTGRTYEDGSFLSVERKRSTFVKKHAAKKRAAEEDGKA